MKRFKWFRIDLATQGEYLCFSSTDEQELEWIVAEIKKKIPKCSVHYPINADYKLPLDKTYQVAVWGVKDKGGGLATWMSYWIMDHLCSQGWEPFAVEPGNQIHLRYEEIYLAR